jgi:hypothetical protein
LNYSQSIAAPSSVRYTFGSQRPPCCQVENSDLSRSLAACQTSAFREFKLKSISALKVVGIRLDTSLVFRFAALIKQAASSDRLRGQG